jgi:hypothetical protein
MFRIETVLKFFIIRRKMKKQKIKNKNKTKNEKRKRQLLLGRPVRNIA